jgi:hypothetical protein
MAEEQRPVFDFANDSSIDLDDLHMEWARQAQKRKKYADEVAYFARVIKQQKKLIGVKDAQLKKEIARITVTIKTLNAKATVQQIDAEILLSDDKDLIKAKDNLSDEQDKLIDLEYDLDSAKNALKAMDDKKDGLENEVSLWKGNYFATPRERRDVDAGKIMDKEVEGKKVQEHREGLNRRTRKR